MPKILKMVLLCCAAAWLSAGTVFALELTIVLPQDVLEDYQQHRQHLKTNAATHDVFRSPFSRRDVVEVQLLLSALERGGYTSTPVFITADSYSRILRMLTQNEAMISGNTLWLSDIEKNAKLFASSALIQRGEFEAGLFTAKSNQKARNVTSIKELQGLSAVSNRFWVEDWNALSSMRLRELQHQPTWDAMVRLVNSHRADLLLAPFPATDDLRLKVGDMEFVPVGAWKVQLFGSRHYGVAKAHKHSYALIRALDDGLLQLHRDGTVLRALHDAGFFNDKVKSWPVANPKPPIILPRASAGQNPSGAEQD